MDKKTQFLLDQATLARRALASGTVKYEDAMRTVKRYTDVANKKGEALSKKMKTPHKKIDPRGFTR